MASQREKVSRQLHGSDERHRDTARKYARKVTVETESHTKDRYKKALKKQQMMSSEESSFEEDGNKFFRVRKRTWDSLELKKAKKIADTAFAIANPGVVQGRKKRVRGDQSTAKSPVELSKDDSWVTYYGTVYPKAA